jgi:Concanavalin A-like lectin/glucanases superfamily
MARARSGAPGARQAAFAGAVVVAAVAVGCTSVLGIDDLPGEADAAPGDATFADASGDASAPPDAGAGKDVGTDGPADTGVGSTPEADTGANNGGTVVSLDGCVLLLHMDEPTWSGAGSVKDSSGQGNDGTPEGTAGTTANGKFGRAALLDGNGWVDVPSSDSLDGPVTQLTYSAWIYPTGLTDGTASPGIISKRQGYAENVSYTLFLWTSNAAWVDLEAYRNNSVTLFTNGAWYHLAVVYDGTQTAAGAGETIYVNGALDSVHAAGPSLAANTQDVLIGNLPGGGNNFIGMIDEVAIWTRALSADEIKSLYLADGGL